METSQLVLLLFMVITTCESSDTAEPKCKESATDYRVFLEGEAFYFVPEYTNLLRDLDNVTWYKNNSQISTDETENVHHHGGALFFLNLTTENSGLYMVRYVYHSVYHNHCLEVEVYKPSPAARKKLLFGGMNNSDKKVNIACPDPVRRTCEMLQGTFTWKKDSSPLEGYHHANIWIENAKEGIYTCVCTWTHNNMEYISSGSRKLTIPEPSSHEKVKILSPIEEQIADEGVEIQLNCSVLCGINAKSFCSAKWEFSSHQSDGYHVAHETVNTKPFNSTISTATLTIKKVAAQDFKTEFKCIGVGLQNTEEVTLTLKRRESIIPLVIGGLCVFFFFVFAAVLIKCFAIDLALFFRPYLPLSRYKKDAKVYDAYVIYQTQSTDKATEDTLCQFVTKFLPSVLEEKCGYRLFIHGRDDLPGEDHLELVEDRMKQSSRLMVLLSPGPASESEPSDLRPASPHNSVIGGFDWQVGLHQALVQGEMSVILIQLGDTGPQGYKHLPAGLQHLIGKSAPIKWPEGSRGASKSNSRFWKRVRYLMPATPATKYPQSAIV